MVPSVLRSITHQRQPIFLRPYLFMLHSKMPWPDLGSAIISSQDDGSFLHL